MRTLPIRWWMLVGIFLFFALTGILYHFTSTLNYGFMSPNGQTAEQRQSALDTSSRLLSSNASQWRNPSWQRSVREKLQHLSVYARIETPEGQTIFQTRRGQSYWYADREVVVMDGARELGVVRLYAGGMYGAGGPLPAILAMILALAFIGRQIGRYVIRPLEAVSSAARSIASGNLDFTVPTSRVREVAEVSAAFEAMGESLRASINEQAKLEEERRFFVSAIAHDLRTPLFSLRGYLDGLERGIADSPEKVARYIRVCHEKSDQLDRLVSDLFAYTRAEFLDQTLSHNRVDLSFLLAQAVEGFQPRARERGVQLSVETDGQPHVIEGDAHLLERALENLLDNALRYTPRGGIIWLRSLVNQDRYELVVEDSGPGIAPQDVPHVFEPLYRGEQSRNPETGGVGLGLPIARRILRAHRGDLMADNREEGGARFVAWLPRSQLLSN